MFVHRAARSSYRIAIIWRNNKIIAHTVLLRSNEEQTKICFQKEANKNNDDDGDDDDETGELEYLDTIEHLNMWRPMLNKRSETTPTTQQKNGKNRANLVANLFEILYYPDARVTLHTIPQCVLVMSYSQ